MDREEWYASATAASPVNVVNYRYDAADNLIETWDATSHNTFTYDERDLLETADNKGTTGVPRTVLTYDYDPNGNVTEAADDRGTVVSSVYGKRNLLTTRTWKGADGVPATVAYTYDKSGRVARAERYNAGISAGTTITGYDPTGRVTRIIHTGPAGNVLSSFEYGYDLAGRLVMEVRPDQSVEYRYDPAGQLTSADYTGQPDEMHVYDPAGNRIGDGVVIGPDNRLESDADFTYL